MTEFAQLSLELLDDALLLLLSFLLLGLVLLELKFLVLSHLLLGLLHPLLLLHGYLEGGDLLLLESATHHLLEGPLGAVVLR